MTTETIPEVYFKENDIQMFSGQGYDFEHPTAAMIHLADIAHHLSQMCRFAGAPAHRYQGNPWSSPAHVSVAEHSVLVSRILEKQGYDRQLQRYGLMHDAHEAYIWDCPRPLKPLLGHKFEELAAWCDAAIQARFELPSACFRAPEVKAADDMALCAEARAFMRHGAEHWANWESRYQYVPPLPDGLRPHGWEATPAKWAFLDRAKVLGL